MPVISKKPKARTLTIPRVVGTICLAFGVLFIVENFSNDGTDYDMATVNQLRKQGYDVKISKLPPATEKPKQIHIEQQQITHITDGAVTNVQEEVAPADDPFNREVAHGHPWPSPIELLGDKARLNMVPLYGVHRPTIKEAVFGFARGADFDTMIRFVESLVVTEYKGDIVLAVSQKNELTDEMKEFLEFHSKYSNLVVYTAELVCKKIKLRVRCKVFKMFQHKEIGGYLPDPRPHREIGQLRFEYYWAWSTLYTPQTKVFLLDTWDVLFQSHPFAQLPEDANFESTIWTWEESNAKNLGDDPDNRLWLREGHERKYLHTLGRRPVVCAGTVLGGAAAIETLTRAMVNQWDVTQCTIYGCDQGHFNWLIHGNHLVGSPNITEVVLNKFGESFVMSLAIEIKYGAPLRKTRLLQGGSDKILNKKKEVAAIVHQFTRNEELKGIYFGKKTNSYRKDWEARKSWAASNAKL